MLKPGRLNISIFKYVEIRNNKRSIAKNHTNTLCRTCWCQGNYRGTSRMTWNWRTCRPSSARIPSGRENTTTTWRCSTTCQGGTATQGTTKSVWTWSHPKYWANSEMRRGSTPKDLIRYQNRRVCWPPRLRRRVNSWLRSRIYIKTRSRVPVTPIRWSKPRMAISITTKQSRTDPRTPVH